MQGKTSFDGLNIPQDDIVFKVIVKHDELLTDFLNSFLDSNRSGKKIVKIITKTVEEKDKQDEPETYAKVLVELSTGEPLVFHLIKKGMNLLIAHTKKEPEIEVL